MTTSKRSYKKAYVWIWLPGKTEPVVAGVLRAEGKNFVFNYGKSYLSLTKQAIPVYDEELPLESGQLPLLKGLTIPGCLRDASPDAWGRRVILNKKFGKKGEEIDVQKLDELTYMLESGSDRIGALDFQDSSTEYIPRLSVSASLEELINSAQRVEDGIPLTPELDRALHHASSIGGARPKALIEDGEIKYIAKFSSTTDLYNVVKVEFIAMRLAALSGLNVAKVSLAKSSNKDVLLIKRFDRKKTCKGWLRSSMVSALTILALDEMMARYASYEDLAEIIRHKFTDASKTLKELFSRIVFNVLCGNTDDHARNHAAFWDGKSLSLTPAYDICPQPRTGNEATQAMLIFESDRSSQISTCIKAASRFQLTENEVKKIVDYQVQIITKNWDAVCDEAELSKVDRNVLWRRQFLNPYSEW